MSDAKIPSIAKVKLTNPRFFLFHASLVIALAILGDSESAEVAIWQADLEAVRGVFRITFADNSLGQRCADILDVIVPSNLALPDTANWDNVQFDPTLFDFSNWPTDGGGEFFGLFGWPDSGSGV